MAKTAGDNQTAVISTAVPVAPSVTVRDAAGNPFAGATVTFAASGGGTVTGGTAISNTSGIATLGSWTLGALGSNTLTASSGTLTPVTFTGTATGRPVTVRTYSTGDATKAITLLDNGDKIQGATWTTSGRPGTAFVASSYIDSGRGIDTRVFYGQSDAATKVYDRKTGESINIILRDTRVDFLIYDRNGQYSSGLAVISSNSKLYIAKILTNPSFNGQLAAVSDRVSFSVLTKADAGLGPLVEAPASFTTFFNQTVGKAVATSGNVLSSLPGFEARDATGFGSQGAAAITTDAFRRGLTNAGLFLVASGVALPLLGIAAGTLPIALFAGGLGAIAIANVPNYHLDALDQFNDSLSRFFHEGVSLNQAPQETIQAGMSSLQSAGALVRRGIANVTTKVGDIGSDVLQSFVRPSDVPPTTGAPSAGSSPVDGYAVDQANTLYPLTGSVSGTGQVSTTGTSGGRTVTINGSVSGTTFNGTYSGSPGSGTLTGTTSALASCQTQQASGGQGTFARAFNMGQTSGSVTFTYDAFSIPDAFQVATGGVTVFSTGGAVSGTGGKTFQLAGSPLVFVSVSAPLSGTAWNFSLSCPV